MPHVGVVLPAEGRSGDPDPGQAPTRGELKRFCRALSDAANDGVRAHVYQSYGALLKKLDYGVVDLAWLPPLVALKAISQSSARPVAVPVRGESAWFWSAIFVRNDSPIHGLDDLKDRRAVWVDRDSASGYLLPRATLRAAGVDVDSVFSEEVFVKTHDAVAREVLKDSGTIGAAYAHLDADGNVERAAWGDADVRLIKTAGPIPADLLAASSSADAGLVEATRAALVEGGDSELARAARQLFSADRFASVDAAHTAHLGALGRSLASMPLF